MNEFIEQIQAFFVTFRDQETIFCDCMTDAVQKYISVKLAANDEANVPDELKEVMKKKWFLYKKMLNCTEKFKMNTSK